MNDTAGSGGIHQNRKADPVSSKWIQMLKWPRQMKIRIVDALHHQITQRPFGHTQGSMVVQRPRSTALPSSNRLNHKGTQRCKWLSHHKLTGGGNITSRHSCTRNHTPKTLFLMWFLQPLQRLFPVCICLKAGCLIKQLKGPLFQYRTKKRWVHILSQRIGQLQWSWYPFEERMFHAPFLNEKDF